MTPLIYVIEWLFLTTILFWCHKGNFEGHSILFYYDFVVTSTPVTMAFGSHISGKQQHTAHFSQPDEQSRISLRREREHFLSDVLSSAVGGLCDPCGSRLIGPWLSWGCVLAEVLVDGVIFFCFEQVLSIFLEPWNEPHIPHYTFRI